MIRAGTAEQFNTSDFNSNINLPSFDGGGGCTGERKTEDGKISASIDSYSPKSNMPVIISFLTMEY